MNERKMKASQRNLVRQRDEARAELERVKGTVSRLTQSMEELVAARVVEDHQARRKAEAERDAVLVNLEAAIIGRLGEKAQELNALHTQVTALERERDGLLKDVGDLTADHQATGVMVARLEARIAALEKELASRKMGEARELRKRIHDKTEQIRTLEKTVEDYARTYRRLIRNGHRTALKVALDEENTASRLDTIESQP